MKLPTYTWEIHPDLSISSLALIKITGTDFQIEEGTFIMGIATSVSLGSTSGSSSNISPNPGLKLSYVSDVRK